MPEETLWSSFFVVVFSDSGSGCMIQDQYGRFIESSASLEILRMRRPLSLLIQRCVFDLIGISLNSDDRFLLSRHLQAIPLDHDSSHPCSNSPPSSSARCQNSPCVEPPASTETLGRLQLPSDLRKRSEFCDVRVTGKLAETHSGRVRKRNGCPKAERRRLCGKAHGRVVLCSR